jgi:hypothetical protein
VTWSSSNTAIATVSTSGLVTGVAAGTSNITVTTQDGDYSEYSEITVTNVSVTGVTVSPTSASIAVNGTQQLTATISPSNATNKNVTWSSSNTAIATVSTSGLVTGVAAGSATITVTTSDGGFHATSAITVTSSGGGGTISFIGRTQANTNTGSTSVTISTPSGIANGELMLVAVTNYGSTPATPSGWTKLASTSNSVNDNVAVFYQTWTTGSPTSYTFGSGNLGWPKAVMRVYSGTSLGIDASSAAPATSGTNTNGTSFALPALSATATANEEYVGFYACDTCSTITGPSGLGDGTSNTTQWSSYDGDLLYASSGSSVPAKTATASTGGNWIGFDVTVK